MISLAPRSFRVCDRPSPVFGLLLRPNSISGVRYASLTSAIERGRRRSLSAEEGGRKSFQERGRRNIPPPRPNKFGVELNQKGSRSKFRSPEYDLDTDEFIKSGTVRPSTRPNIPEGFYADPSKPKRRGQSEKRQKRQELRKEPPGRNYQRYTNEFPERVKEHVKVPTSIPYTTAASVFIYGASAVEAALRCSRRKLYVLYIYQAQDEPLTPEQNLIRKMALAQGLKVKMAFAGWDSMLDKMSGGRPHNGFVLEASHLPTLPIAHLEPVTDPTADKFHVKLSPQSEEEAKVNGLSNEIQRPERYEEEAKSRFPLILLVDGIVDPGNMGAIIRSAYYLGVDGIVYAGRNSAPNSAITAKASAGATENMTFFRTSNPQEFVDVSRKNGWRFLAADSPGNVFENSNRLESIDRGVGSNTSSPLTEAPTVLMMGNESTGLLQRLKVRADKLVSIPGARFNPMQGIKDAAGIDSLNVSVAAAMLIEMLTRAPLQITDLPAVEQQAKLEREQKEMERKLEEKLRRDEENLEERRRKGEKIRKEEWAGYEEIRTRAQELEPAERERGQRQEQIPPKEPQSFEFN
ncbi:hypothetical protein PISL3812_04600 [Talaromyces islandicus]|uniref:rRNA methyltransferase 1, mitochondrial n=1 Tax=Talaromyces islandicus TaxID=28573 RepID=A0A0U1LY00_TALIS|nr:hypothetical protein PISL3812_04600 [Talaromyces islandicus]